LVKVEGAEAWRDRVTRKENAPSFVSFAVKSGSNA
jgi:hypothetical protein